MDEDLTTLTTLCWEPILVPELLLELSLLLARSSRSSAMVTDGGGGMDALSGLVLVCDGFLMAFALFKVFAWVIISCGEVL